VKRPGGALIFDPAFSGSPGAPRFRQLYAAIRSAILAGRLRPGARLPSTRTLAADLGVSRTTTEEAFAQLEAEGYLTRRTGDGTYVAALALLSETRPARAARTGARRLELSARGALMARSGHPEPIHARAFNAGSPPFDAFPLDVWTRLLSARMKHSGRELLAYGEPAGYRPLREAIASYLRTSRGVQASAEEVLVLTSSQQALDLIGRLLLDPGDTACIEEPGYSSAAAALRAAGAILCPVRIDENGLDVERLRACRETRLVYVTPSHQYPTGVTMSLARRLALVRWARETGGWIVEDDYDSEFRYVGRPLAAVHGLDTGGRVLYVGTFSKTMFPSIRVAYLVVPPELVEPFVVGRSLLDGHTALHTQAALADFMEGGQFAIHLRRMRSLCAERRDALLAAAVALPADRVRLGAADGGFRVAGWLARGVDEAAVVRRGREAGLDLPPLSRCYLSKPRSGLILGYTGLSPSTIRKAVGLLRAVLVPRK
jgi:GntR family transcriptional regulator / MocR family aminotransferase